MNVASVGRPVGCLKTALRRTRFQREFRRNVSVAAAVAPLTKQASNAFSAEQRADIAKVSKFHIYPRVPSIRTTHPDPMPALLEKQITKLDPTGARTRLFSREHADSAKVGDVLMVTTKSGEPFSGAFLQIRRRGQDTAIQLRGQMMKVGVEMWFKIYSPTVTGIDIIWRRPKRARRARLTYMRKPSHDMGSVDQMVFAWKKERYTLRSQANQPGKTTRKQHSKILGQKK
ncbi:translation protein SH3-like domain-containing protein [Fusarium tricinctum]|uniref:Translation protein SH3-like domain-containing protein n=2 Tax=Fusarium tricinctum species complex TaxID=679429 RepID=A0A8K0S4J2_9HYPO|nr:translation protein SH3-like domain-containing protein [Fusarium tricinctum]